MRSSRPTKESSFVVSTAGRTAAWSAITKSRREAPSIGPRDWTDGPGCESATVGVDRTRSRYVGGGCYQGFFERHDAQSDLTRSVMPWPELTPTEPTDKVRYRFNWT